MKRRVIQLKESELKQLISRIIEEQTASAAFTQGQQAGQVAGQQARQAVNKAASQAVGAVKQGATTAIKGITETVITIFKIQIKVVILGAAVVYVIADGIYKVGVAAHNALMKFMSATGKVLVKKYNQASVNTINSLNKIGIALDKGMDFVNQKLTSMKDSTFAVAKYCIDSFKQYGTQQWAKVLVAAAGIKELASMLGGYLKSAWGTIQNQVGVAWENASNWARGAMNTAKQGLQNASNAAKQGLQNFSNSVTNKANQIAQGASGYAGKALGAIQGFLSEMYERYLSFSDDTESILNEAIKYNGKVIL